MSIFDELKGKAEGLKDKAAELMGQHPDKVDGAIDGSGDFFDEKTGGKYSEHVDKFQDGAKNHFNKEDGTTPTE